MRPPRIGRLWIRSRERPATGWSGRGAGMLGEGQLTVAVASSNGLAEAGTALAAVAAGEVSGAAVVIP